MEWIEIFGGVKLQKWPTQEEPSEEKVRKCMTDLGFVAYDLQTIPPWFERSLHGHDQEEIRGAVKGNTTFYFDEGPLTLEPGDIIVIPPGKPHSVKSHNGGSFTAFKGSRSGTRTVTEHGDGKGSVEDLRKRS